MAAVNLLLETNVAGQTILRLVARGSALLAELLRLSQHIPDIFYLNNREAQLKYGEILLDFRYLKNPEVFDHKIESTPVRDLPRSMRATMFH